MDFGTHALRSSHRFPSWMVLAIALAFGCQREEAAKRPIADAAEIDKPSPKITAKAPTQPPGIEARPQASPSQRLAPLTDLERAEAAFASGDWQTARDQAQTILLKTPSDSSAILLLAKCLNQSGQTDQALQTLREIPLDDPTVGTQSGILSATWFALQGKPFDALRLYERLIGRSKRDDQIRHAFVRFLNQSGWRQRAAQELTPLLETRNATETELASLLNLSLPLADSSEAIPLCQALLFLDQDNPADAKESLEQAIRDDPGSNYASDPATLSLLASAYADLKQWNEMAIALSRIEDDQRWHPRYWTAMGDWLNSQNETTQAIECYRHSVQLDPTFQAGHQRLVRALNTIGENEAAEQIERRQQKLAEVYEKNLHPTPKDAAQLKTLIRDLLELNHVDQAEGWLERFIERYPSEIRFMVEIRVRKREPAAKYCFDGWVDWPATPLDQLPNARTLLSKLSQESGTPSVFDSLPKTESKIAFANVAKQRSLDHDYLNDLGKRKPRLLKIHQQLGGGLASIDYDLDGHTDLYCAQAGGKPPSIESASIDQLFRQQIVRGEITYQNVTNFMGIHETGFTLGVTAGDLNQDGFTDLAVGNLGHNRLYLNQGDGTFREILKSTFGKPDDFTTGLAIADVNGDQLNDIVEINYMDDPKIYDELKVNNQGILVNVAGPVMFQPAADRLWLSDPSGQLREQAFNGDAPQPSLGLIVSDLSPEPGLEIFIANDTQPNHFWVGDQSSSPTDSKTWQDRAVVSGLAVSARGGANACMGVALADFDQNGFSDLIVTNWIDEWVNYFRQTSAGVFRDSAARYQLDQVSEGALGFGTQAIDFDNDSAIDLVITNGHIDDLTHLNQPQKMPTQLLVNQGRRFELTTAKNDFFQADHLGRCLIRTDYNRDGKMDFVVSDIGEPVALLENQTPSSNHWVQFELVGTFASRDAIGTHITVTAGEKSWTQVTATGDGYQGRNEVISHFGLGESNAAVSVHVQWPDGKSQRWESVSTDGRYLLIQNETEAYEVLTR